MEWGVDRINAPQVWSTYNDRGENIVVGNVDTGVLYTHGALVAKYRGNLGGGNFNHNYNWWDPSAVCGRGTPCDNNGHGTHTMGTMVGDDGDPGTNQIGVAPHATWIAAKGCETNSCSTNALLSSGQFMVAPTNLNGQNPQPNLRPDIVSNSWGNGNGGDTFYQAIVQAWVASGIFPSFASGNSGPGCGTVWSPGSYSESYTVGSFDINNVIASSSSRGPSPLGGIIKPNIAAPGVNVRSSWNNGSYQILSGTSMATPHLSATVALMWSAVPALRRNISGTEAILNQTAIDTAGTCGGTTENNNTWGEGKLDALAAVAAAVGPTASSAASSASASASSAASTATSTTSATSASTATSPTSTSASASASGPCRVPRVLGLRLGAAKTKIRRAHCSVGNVRRVRSRRSLRRRVVNQSPRPGTIKRRNFPVKLAVGRP